METINKHQWYNGHVKLLKLQYEAPNAQKCYFCDAYITWDCSEGSHEVLSHGTCAKVFGYNEAWRDEVVSIEMEDDIPEAVEKVIRQKLHERNSYREEADRLSYEGYIKSLLTFNKVDVCRNKCSHSFKRVNSNKICRLCWTFSASKASSSDTESESEES